MPKCKRLRHGIGPKFTVYKKFLHPQALVSARYPNASKVDVLDDLIAVGQEEKVVCSNVRPASSCATMILTMDNCSMPLPGSTRSNKRERWSTSSMMCNKMTLKLLGQWLLVMRRFNSGKFQQF
jgi:hypothetical protein